MSDESCILADRRMTSLRQQSDQLLSVVDKDKISTLYQRREKVRMKALTSSNIAFKRSICCSIML